MQKSPAACRALFVNGPSMRTPCANCGVRPRAPGFRHAARFQKAAWRVAGRSPGQFQRYCGARTVCDLAGPKPRARSFYISSKLPGGESARGTQRIRRPVSPARGTCWWHVSEACGTYLAARLAGAGNVSGAWNVSGCASRRRAKRVRRMERIWRRVSSARGTYQGTTSVVPSERPSFWASAPAAFLFARYAPAGRQAHVARQSSLPTGARSSLVACCPQRPRHVQGLKPDSFFARDGTTEVVP